VTFTKASDNIFADLGVVNPELALRKAEIAIEIADKIRTLGLTQSQAAKKMGVDQPKVSDIVRGRLASYSVDRLLGMLEGLGRTVRLVFVDTNVLASVMVKSRQPKKKPTPLRQIIVPVRSKASIKRPVEVAL
jgi:predicted XRE-type DNA-binding protein